MTNASNVKRGFTPDSNPKRGNIKIGNNIDINLCKSATTKKECHSLRMTNASGLATFYSRGIFACAVMDPVQNIEGRRMHITTNPRGCERSYMAF